MRTTTNCSDGSLLSLVAAAGFSATSPPQILALAQFLASSFIVLVSIANLPKRRAAHLLHGLVLVPLSGVRKKNDRCCGCPMPAAGHGALCGVVCLSLDTGVFLKRQPRADLRRKRNSHSSARTEEIAQRALGYLKLA